MTVTLSWGSEKKIHIGTIEFSNERKIRKLNGVLSYGYNPAGVAGETDAYVMNKDDSELHDLPVEWSGPDAFIDLPRGRLVLLSLPYVLEDIVKELGVSNSTGDALWVFNFSDGNAQVGSTFVDERRHIPLGDLGSLVVEPNQ